MAYVYAQKQSYFDGGEYGVHFLGFDFLSLPSGEVAVPEVFCPAQLRTITCIIMETVAGALIRTGAVYKHYLTEAPSESNMEEFYQYCQDLYDAGIYSYQ